MKKTKILVATLLAGFVLHQLALCQTNATDANPPVANATAASPATNSDAGGATPAAMAGDSMTASNTPAASAVSNDMASSLSASNAAPGLTGTNATAQAGSTNAPAADGTNAVAAELPISSRMFPSLRPLKPGAAGEINYLLDPKIGYGQPGQNGQPNPEPDLSLRWEHVTARQALLALLDNYGLQLVENPKTAIAKITIKQPNALPP